MRGARQTYYSPHSTPSPQSPCGVCSKSCGTGKAVRKKLPREGKKKRGAGRARQTHVVQVLRGVGAAHVEPGRGHAARERHKEAPLLLVLQQFAHARVPRQRLDAVSVHPAQRLLAARLVYFVAVLHHTAVGVGAARCAVGRAGAFFAGRAPKTYNSSADMGRVADHIFFPPFQSRSTRPHCDAKEGETGPVLLHAMMMLEFFIP